MPTCSPSGTGEGGNAPTSSDTAPQQPTSDAPVKARFVVDSGGVITDTQTRTGLTMLQRVGIGAGIGGAGGAVSGVLQHQSGAQITEDTLIGAAAGAVAAVPAGVGETLGRTAVGVAVGSASAVGASIGMQAVAGNGINPWVMATDAGLGAIPVLGGAAATAWTDLSDLKINISADIVGGLESAACSIWSGGRC
jgi:hypothetical protein